MNITMLKSKIHRAVVTQAELNYVGSITVDSELLKAAGILELSLIHISEPTIQRLIWFAGFCV